MHQTMTQMLLRRLLHNFYVYDLLRSVESEEIKDIRRMCGEGGFNLNKFICTGKKFSNLFLNAIKRDVLLVLSFLINYELNFIHNTYVHS